MLMEALSGGRAISLPAQAVGSAKWTARVVGAYTEVRRQFGVPIGRFDGIQEPLARIAGSTYLMEAARVFTCGAVDAGHRPSVISAIVKSQLTEMARDVVSDGMDVLGGAAICQGPRNLLADAYKGSPIGITVEGANILTRTLIIYGQGALRCHPYAQREITALEAGDGPALARALLGHGRFLLRNLVRSTVLSLTRGRLASAPGSRPTARYYGKLLWASARFAVLTDLALLGYGSRLKRSGKLSGRFADALSWMFLALSCLRRFEAEGRRSEDLPLVHWCLELSFQRLQIAFYGICRNFQAPLLGPLLRHLAAPWIRYNSLGEGPSDRMVAEAAATLQTSREQRDRLTAGLYLGKGAIRKLEEAFTATREAEPVLAKIAAATRHGDLPAGRPWQLLEQAVACGAITEQEADLVLKGESTRREAIRVSTFSPEEYTEKGG